MTQLTYVYFSKDKHQTNVLASVLCLVGHQQLNYQGTYVSVNIPYNTSTLSH